MTSTSLPWARMAAEFVVVFLGVSLSFLADDWRQHRNDRATERASLAELAADLESDFATLSAIRERMEGWESAASWVLRHLGDSSAPTDSVVHRLRTLVYYDTYPSVSSAYVGLKDSGQMAVIQDRALRRRLVNYYEVAQPYMRHFDARSGEDYAALRAIVTSHLRLDVSASSALWPVPPMTFQTSWSTFRSDPRTRSVLEVTGVDAGNWAERISVVIEVNRTLQSALGADPPDAE